MNNFDAEKIATILDKLRIVYVIIDVSHNSTIKDYEIIIRRLKAYWEV